MNAQRLTPNDRTNNQTKENDSLSAGRSGLNVERSGSTGGAGFIYYASPCCAEASQDTAGRVVNAGDIR